MSQPVFRFAPSPNGELHLGHARSALINQQMARAINGKLLLRIEDIDTVRCTPAHEAQMLRDLEWLGFEWDAEPLRQSERIEAYREVLDILELEGLVYPSKMSRNDIRQIIALNEQDGTPWPTDPDGAAIYPGTERELDAAARRLIKEATDNFTLRLDTNAALKYLSKRVDWNETGFGPENQTGKIVAEPLKWGDPILERRDTPASYHLSCVVDDIYQGVTHVVRGKDLFHATSLHRLLQELLGAPVPIYHHHELIMGDDGCKLSKSNKDTSLRQLREAGASAKDIHRMALTQVE